MAHGFAAAEPSLLEDCLDLLSKFLDKIPNRRITARLPEHIHIDL